MYHQNEDLEKVAETQVQKHPYLENQGSGYSGWTIGLGTKMNDYHQIQRKKLRKELNFIQRKKARGASKVSPNQVKKSRKAEMKCLPNYPTKKSESLEAPRQALILQHKEKNSLPIQQIVSEMPFVTRLQTRKPALFTSSEVKYK